MTVIFYSNEQEVAQFGHYIFDTLWEKAIPAKTRIKEIEENLKRETIKVIQDPEEASELFLDLVKQADEEIHILFPNYNILKLYQTNGILNTLGEKSNGLEVKVLVKEDSKPVQPQQSNHQENNNLICSDNKIQLLTTSIIESRVMILIVDKKESLSIEVKDENLDKVSLGLATYSNSQSTILSYYSLYEMFWIKANMENKRPS